MYEIEFHDYCVEHIDNFEDRAQAARAVMDSRRCSLSAADYSLFAEVCRALEDFCEELGIDAEEIDEII
jgi:hypothetical protein